MPDVVREIGLTSENIKSSDVPMDENIVSILRKI